MAHHRQKFAFGPVGLFRSLFGNQQLLLFGNILNDDIESDRLLVDYNRCNRCQHLNRVPFPVPNVINIHFCRAAFFGIGEDFLKVLCTDNPAQIHSRQFRDTVACQLAGLLIRVDDSPLKIKGNDRIMVIFLQRSIPFYRFLQLLLHNPAFCDITAYGKYIMLCAFFNQAKREFNPQVTAVGMQHPQLDSLIILCFRESKHGVILGVDQPADVPAHQLPRIIAQHLAHRRRAVSANIVPCRIIDYIRDVRHNLLIQLVCRQKRLIRRFSGSKPGNMD
ncbi:hypothetical protein D3C75_513950 [compost metagenome]